MAATSGHSTSSMRGFSNACIRCALPESDTSSCSHRLMLRVIVRASSTRDRASVGKATGGRALTSALIVSTNTAVLREYINSLWGAKCAYLPTVLRRAGEPPPRVESRIPRAAEKVTLHRRDGFHCRFCRIPVIRAEVRRELTRLYPELELWGRRNDQQHAAFQVMWAQYDHLVPHSWGGSNSPDNMVVTCAGWKYSEVMDRTDPLFPVRRLGLKLRKMCAKYGSPSGRHLADSGQLGSLANP
jgi:hypothetical protein